MSKSAVMLLITWIGFSGCEMPSLEARTAEVGEPIVYIRDYKKVQYEFGKTLALSPKAAYAILIPAEDLMSCELLDSDPLSLKSTDLVDCALYLTPSHWNGAPTPVQIRIQVDKQVQTLSFVPTS